MRLRRSVLPIAMLAFSVALSACSGTTTSSDATTPSATSSPNGAVEVALVNYELGASTTNRFMVGLLGSMNTPDAVLARACLHTLARSPMSDRSAAELARELPALGVAQAEAKVRQTLRTGSLFTEVWRGRWQVGAVAPALVAYIDQVSTASA